MSFITLQPWVMELWSYDRTQDASAGCFFSKITKEEVSLEMKNVPELQLLKDFQARKRSSDAVAVTHRTDWWAIGQKLFGFNLSEIIVNRLHIPGYNLLGDWLLQSEFALLFCIFRIKRDLESTEVIHKRLKWLKASLEDKSIGPVQAFEMHQELGIELNHNFYSQLEDIQPSESSSCSEKFRRQWANPLPVP